MATETRGGKEKIRVILADDHAVVRGIAPGLIHSTDELKGNHITS